MRHSTTERPDGDRYLTEPAMVRFFTRWFGVENIFRLATEHSWLLDVHCVLDPAAAGYDNWTIGQEVAEGLGISIRVASDLNPVASWIPRRDFYDLTPHRYPEATLLITNPPYGEHYDPWLAHSLELADNVVLLWPYDSVVVRAKNLVCTYQPTSRMSFGLLPQDAMERIRWNISPARVGPPCDVGPSNSSLSGWGMSATGKSHCWAHYRRGYTGPKAQVIEAVLPEDKIMPLISQDRYLVARERQITPRLMRRWAPDLVPQIWRKKKHQKEELTRIASSPSLMPVELAEVILPRWEAAGGVEWFEFWRSLPKGVKTCLR